MAKKLTLEVPHEHTETSPENLRQRTDTLSAVLATPSLENTMQLSKIMQDPSIATVIAEQNPLLASRLYLESLEGVHQSLHNPAKPTTVMGRFFSVFGKKSDVPKAASMASAALHLRVALKGLFKEERSPAGIMRDVQERNRTMVKKIYGIPSEHDANHVAEWSAQDSIAQEKMIKELQMPEAAVRQLRYVTLALSEAPETDRHRYLKHHLPAKVGRNSLVPYEKNDPALEEIADTRNSMRRASIIWLRDIANNTSVMNNMDGKAKSIMQTGVNQSFANAIHNIEGLSAQHTNIKALYNDEH